MSTQPPSSQSGDTQSSDQNDNAASGKAVRKSGGNHSGKRSTTTANPSTNTKRRALYAIHPWRCEHHADHSAIKAYVEASGAWETVASVPPTSGASAETLATFITGILNAHRHKEDILSRALSVLQEMLEDGLTYTTETEAESLLRQVKGRD